jgi:integrase
VFDRKAEAQRHLASVEHSKLTGGYIDPAAGRVTFRSYAEAWRSVQAHHRPSTVEDVERQLRLHIYPHLGDRPIAAVRASEVQSLVLDLAQRLAPTTVKVVYTRVVAVFAAAVRDRLIGSSPCVGVKLPRTVPSSTLRVLTTAEVAAQADAIEPRYRAMVITGAGTGLRPAELYGLTVDRVDFLRRVLRVDRQLGRSGELAPPKSDASYRTIPLPEVVLVELAEHLAAYPPGEEGFVFTTSRGTPVSHPAFFAVWRTARTRAGLPQWATPHDLRHFYASLLIARGASVKVVQARLGHASAATTLDIYGHLWPDDEDTTRIAVDREFEDLFSRSRVTTVSQAEG